MSNSADKFAYLWAQNKAALWLNAWTDSSFAIYLWDLRCQWGQGWCLAVVLVLMSDPLQNLWFGFIYIWFICVAPSWIMCHLNMFWKHLVSKPSIVFLTDFSCFLVLSWICGLHVAVVWCCRRAQTPGNTPLDKNLETTYGPLIAQLLTLKLCSWGEIFWYRNLCWISML